MDSLFKPYRRKAIAELRPVTADEAEGWVDPSISISQADLDAGSPSPLDMIARNPQNHDDQWLVAAQYFIDNFEPIDLVVPEVSDA